MNYSAKENRSMTTPRRALPSLAAVLAMTLALCLLAPSESGGQGNGKDKAPERKYVPGENHLKGKARWEWHLLSGGKEVDKGTFMGYVDGTIKHGTDQKQVGTWKSNGPDSVSVTFTWPRLKGSWEFRRVEAKVPTYEGTLKVASQKKSTKVEKLRVEILND
jgi:hypothetical protein